MDVPKILEHLPQFPIGTPHDAHEVLLAIIDKIEKDVGRELFYGTNLTTLIDRTGKKTTINGVIGSLMFSVKDGETLDDAYNRLLEMEYVLDTSVGSFVCKRTEHLVLPKVLICVITNSRPVELPETFHGRKLNCVISHLGNHYVAIVKENDESYLIDDDKMYKVQGKFTGPVYMCLFS